MEAILKFPRTPHLEGSRLQIGDEDLAAIPFRHLAGRFLVVEEKLDGANCGIGFSARGELRLQSRGHLLLGGGRERHFDLFKTWAHTHADRLWDLLGDRYLLYGEWLYAKHTIYYNALRHYFQEFDMLDKPSGVFLGTERRRALLAEHPYIVSANVLFSGVFHRHEDLTALLATSHHIDPPHLANLRTDAAALGLDVARVVRETDPSDVMEGLYLKVEEQGRAVERCKFVRHGFLAAVEQSQSHWLTRPIVPNRLADGVDIFGRP